MCPTKIAQRKLAGSKRPSSGETSSHATAGRDSKTLVGEVYQTKSVREMLWWPFQMPTRAKRDVKH